MTKKKLFMACLAFFFAGFMLSVLVAPLLGATILYAGTSNPGMVYKYDGTTWTAISGSLGFAVLDVIEFDGDLYAATMSTQYYGPGEVYRYDGGTSWTLIFSTDNQVCDLEVWSGDLYAGTAWNNGKLYRYNETTDTFDHVGTMPDTDSIGNVHAWGGIRAMYPWSATGHLHLGDLGYDCLGRWDGSSMIYDAFLWGSCIYDFAEFNGRLYAGAYAGRLLWSSTGIGYYSWSSHSFTDYYYIWELEAFQGLLYTGNYGGNLRSLDSIHNVQNVWTTPSGAEYQQICSMVADGDSALYIGTGGEAGYVGYNIGIAKVYTYDGSSTPVEIFDADGGDTDGTDHAGIQCLYIPPCIYVDIDIKPGSCPNSINLGSNGNVPVAIFSAEDFDATTIDPTTVTLAGASVKIKGKGTPMSSFEDVDGDGLLDIVVHVDTSALELASGDTVAVLEGETYDGIKIRGTDTVRIVKE